jgi:O-antigen ligase
LEYEPCLGALLLAGLSLPLMFAYVRRAKVSLTEGLFLWFVFCTTAYTRDFSHIRWPGTPLFVTDVVLLVLILSISLLPSTRYPRCPLLMSVFLFSFLGAGILSVTRGFWGHRELLLVLRDSTLVVYALFLFVAHNLLRTWISMKRTVVWFVLGTTLGTLNGLAWFIAVPEERRFIYYGVYVLISLAGILLAIANRLVRPRVGWIFAGLLCLGLMLANARSLFVSLVILLFMGLLAGRLVFSKTRFARLVATAFIAAPLAAFALLLLLHTRAGQDFTVRVANELVTGVFRSSDDPDWQYRLIAWEEAWRRFEKSPLIGEGFGVPFVFELADADVRPHNTFLTVLYKMGVIGFLPLLGLIVSFLWFGFRAVRRNLKNSRVAFLQIMLLAQVAFCLYGAANLLLESPFLGSLFWTAMGLGLRMVQLLDVERLLGTYGRAGQNSNVPHPKGFQRLGRLWSPATIRSAPR